jgi:hypothetical protein
MVITKVRRQKRTHRAKRYYLQSERTHCVRYRLAPRRAVLAHHANRRKFRGNTRLSRAER